MDNDRIKIDFPRKLEVESPDLSALNQVAQRISNWLHNDLKKIIEPLQILLEIPLILGDFKTSIVNQFTNMFTNQVETQLISRRATISVEEKKIELIEGHIDKKKNQFIDTKGRILNRYKNMISKLVENHRKMMHQLDEHIFQIFDTIYPQKIQEKFSYISYPNQNYLLAHTKETSIVRYQAIDFGYQNTKKSANILLDKRAVSYDEIAELSSTIEEGKYALPYWVIKVKNRKNNSITEEILFDWEISGDDSPIKQIDINKLRNYCKDHVLNQLDNNENQINEFYTYLKKNTDIPKSEIERFRTDCKNFNFVKEVYNAK